MGAELNNWIYSVIDERRQGGVQKNDLLAQLMAANETADLPVEVLRDMMVTVLLGGSETTSVTLSLMLYMASKNPEIEAKCVEEIRSASDIGNPEELEYCKAVVKEVLHRYPWHLVPSKRISRLTTALSLKLEPR